MAIGLVWAWANGFVSRIELLGNHFAVGGLRLFFFARFGSDWKNRWSAVDGCHEPGAR
jgi:hypothetical protein